MKKVCTLLLVLALSGGMSSCTKFQTIGACKNDCDDKFATEVLLFPLQAVIIGLYEKNRCYDNCEGR
jgi:hypothetical protein